MNLHQNEVLALQELPSATQDETVIGRSSSTPVCSAVISGISGITAASVSAAWNSGLTWGCGRP